MATVRFSQQLTKDVENNVRALFSPELKKARDNVPKDWGQKLYDSIFSADIQAKMKACPTWCFDEINSIQFNGFRNANNSWSNGETEVRRYSGFDLRLPLDTDMPFPSESALRNGSEVNGFHKTYNAVQVDFDHVQFEWLKKPVEVYTKGIFDVLVKQNEFIQNVATIMKTYSTLAPALKAWKPLWDLLPDDAKHRHKKIVERTKTKTGQELDLDLNSMTSTVTFNKLSRR